MARPREGDWLLMKRIGRYLLGAPRLVQRYHWQERPKAVTTCVDSDWAGCRRTCRSTSGGVCKLGAHVLSFWAATQGVVALSSAEAELYALVKGAVNTSGMISLLGDFGETVNGRISSDASAAIGIVNRTVVGKLRHIRVQYLWLQERVREGEVKVLKIPGEDNPADIFTKNVPAEVLRKHLTDMCFETG